MTTPLRRRLRLARRGAWYALAGALVMLALMAGITSQLLPLAERHPDRIAAWLSTQAQRPVSFARLQTEWTRRGPLLRVDGLRIGEGATAVPVGEAEILVAQYAGFLPGRSFTELRLRGLDLSLLRGSDGRWQVRGLPGQAQTQGDPLEALESLGELQVVDGRLSVIAPELGLELTLPKVDLRLRVNGDRIRAAARTWMREGVAPISAVLDFDRGRGDGRAYLAMRRADLASWAPLVRAAGVEAVAGQGQVALWAELRAHRIALVTLDGDLRDLRLEGAPFAGADGASRRPMLALDRIEARARWQATAQGWRLDAPRLRMQGLGQALPAVMDGVVVAGGSEYALLAEQLDSGALLSLAALSDRVPDGLRRWMHTAAPRIQLRDAVLSGRRGGGMSVSAVVEDLRFASRGDRPGLSGLAGTLTGDADALVFDFDAARELAFNWPRGFGAPHVVRLDGRIVGWRGDGEAWHLETSALRVDGDGYGAALRGGVEFQGDGTRPVMALAVALDDTAVPVARRFWVRHLMSPATVRWLDAALLEGRLRNGRALVAGDLDDWPFAGPAGLFRAEAELADATVRFHEDWPSAQGLGARVVFEAAGFSITGHTGLGEVAVPRIEASIAEFGRAELQVRAEAATDAGKLLALLRRSPLQAAQGETLEALRASGPATATFSLDQPLYAGGGPSRLGGRIDLRGARLADRRWELEFADVRGRGRYDSNGFTAAGLNVVHDGQPGTLDLRAGPGHVRDPRQAFEAALEARLSATELLDRAPELAWLAPHIAGRSAWTLELAMPANAPATPRADSGRLRLRSNLVGTSLRLPAPLDKPAGVALPTTVETRLPMGEGEVSVALGDRMALRARTRGGRTGVRVALGSSRVTEAPPAHGLVATGHAPTLDAIDWVALAAGAGDGGDGPGLPLQRIDVSTDALQLLGSRFEGTTVRAVPSADGTAVQFEGAALAGSLLLPEADNATLAGRFARLHWRSANAGDDARAGGAGAQGGATAGAPATMTAAADDKTDPAKVPSLNLVVDDLRVGDARLGSASLQTRRAPTGMRIERLQTRAPRQRIDASGEWTGRGSDARTRLQVAVDSDDFGALLAGFGFGGRIASGQGTADFEAGWPGSPAQFRLDALQGKLDLTMKDGRLVELEPGAGRVLGLLSIAELPRRLTLDFRDFFAKGFTFNRIAGHVRFAGGLASSDDLVIDGPAAEIRIRGAANLRAQTYDQTIEVLPKTGNLLTAVGAITGGPVGAAVGAMANAVLQKPLGEINAKVYRVTGPWSDPHVEVSARGQEPAVATKPPPAG